MCSTPMDWGLSPWRVRWFKKTSRRACVDLSTGWWYRRRPVEASISHSATCWEFPRGYASTLVIDDDQSSLHQHHVENQLPRDPRTSVLVSIFIQLPGSKCRYISSIWHNVRNRRVGHKCMWFRHVKSWLSVRWNETKSWHENRFHRSSPMCVFNLALRMVSELSEIMTMLKQIIRSRVVVVRKTCSAAILQTKWCY